MAFIRPIENGCASIWIFAENIVTLQQNLSANGFFRIRANPRAAFSHGLLSAFLGNLLFGIAPFQHQEAPLD
jgi:hypothetical protein